MRFVRHVFKVVALTILSNAVVLVSTKCVDGAGLCVQRQNKSSLTAVFVLRVNVLLTLAQ